jgi:uncharacterized membrane protein YesL
MGKGRENAMSKKKNELESEISTTYKKFKKYYKIMNVSLLILSLCFVCLGIIHYIIFQSINTFLLIIIFAFIYGFLWRLHYNSYFSNYNKYDRDVSYKINQIAENK